MDPVPAQLLCWATMLEKAHDGTAITDAERHVIDGLRRMAERMKEHA